MVKQLELAIRSQLDAILKASGTTTQYTALTVLERHDGLTAAQLARDSFVTAQAMADMVRALESRTMIRASRPPENRRELRIYLTDQSRALLDKQAWHSATCSPTASPYGWPRTHTWTWSSATATAPSTEGRPAT